MFLVLVASSHPAGTDAETWGIKQSNLRAKCAEQLQLDITFIFLLPQRCGGRQHGSRGFGAADATMLTVVVVLGGGM